MKFAAVASLVVLYLASASALDFSFASQGMASVGQGVASIGQSITSAGQGISSAGHETVSSVNSNLDSWSEKMKELRQKLENTVQEAIDAASKKTKYALETAQAAMQKLKETAIGAMQKLRDNVAEAIEKVNREIKHELNEAKKEGADVSECRRMVQELNKAAVAILRNVSSCTTDKFDEGESYVQSIMVTSEQLIQNLTDIKKNASACMENVDGVISGAKAFGCVNAQMGRAMVEATRTIPSFSSDVANLSQLVITLEPSLMICYGNGVGLHFAKHAGTVVPRIHECIQHQMQKLHDSYVSTSTSSLSTSTYSSTTTAAPAAAAA